MAAKKRETVFISEADQYVFAQGSHYDIYKKLGAHPSNENGKDGVFFAVWAPNAASVHVTGTFNDWNEDSHELKRLGPGGIFAGFFPGIKTGELYKYLITTPDGRKLYKADPYANSAEVRPGTASRIADIGAIKWTDSVWMKNRAEKDMNKEPMAIYECHIGSWMKHPTGEDGFYTYRQFADRMVEYLSEMKYTHVELMGIAEYPFDGSWGYQVTGYYAPTSRYGGPEDFAYMVNLFHKHGIGVILDWVPAHFPKDAHGLAEFDGTCLYEHPDTRLGEHPDWGTKIFNYGKTEVKNFLIANALFWIKEFHIDGLRVDAVASMLYLDYGRKDGQWLPNKYGGNENLEAIEFFKHLNSVIRGTYPQVMMIAEETTACPKITAPVEEDGLNFTFKWNMGWMHDFCEYMKLDPYFRKDNHYKMTFAMSYNSSENYILVLSHDEVVHLKCSMPMKMPGFKVDKFANLRAGYTFMFGHCGKKLLFMGQEFAQFSEFNESSEIDWSLFEFDAHSITQNYVKDLNKLYKKEPALYELDSSADGFEWIDANDANRSLLSFERRGKDEKDTLLIICNFTPNDVKNYKLAVPTEGKWKEIFSSDASKYGGEGHNNKVVKQSKAGKVSGRKNYITITVPALSISVFKKKIEK